MNNLEKINKKMSELLGAMREVKSKEQELLLAVHIARQHSEELAALLADLTNKPHISILDYEIDN